MIIASTGLGSVEVADPHSVQQSGAVLDRVLIPVAFGVPEGATALEAVRAALQLYQGTRSRPAAILVGDPAAPFTIDPVTVPYMSLASVGVWADGVDDVTDPIERLVRLNAVALSNVEPRGLWTRKLVDAFTSMDFETSQRFTSDAILARIRTVTGYSGPFYTMSANGFAVVEESEKPAPRAAPPAPVPAPVVEPEPPPVHPGASRERFERWRNQANGAPVTHEQPDDHPAKPKPKPKPKPKAAKNQASKTSGASRKTSGKGTKAKRSRKAPKGT